MKTLIAVIYKHQPDAAAKTLDRLRDLEEEYLIDLHDAVVVRRNDKGKLTLMQSVNLASSGAWTGSFWGILIGMFFGPLGWAVGGLAGAGLGALSGYLSDYGINDDFIRTLSEEVEPCCSALFVLARSMTTDKVIAALEGAGGHLIKTSLPTDIETRLQQALQAGAPTAEEAHA
ncbi:MAG: DUF1269 domain-containing protein [Nevskiales bacterium]|nr:DUF1269 domain-containing protein [Nevskiales bacterium]